MTGWKTIAALLAVVALALALVLAMGALLTPQRAHAQSPVEGFNTNWPILDKPNVPEWTNWIAKDLWMGLDERKRALGPASQQSNDAYGFNYLQTVTGLVGRTTMVWNVTWTNGTNVIIQPVTNFYEVYQTAVLTNWFDGDIVVGSVTCHPRVTKEFFDQWDATFLALLPSYVMEHYSTEPSYLYNIWFGQTNPAEPAEFPLGSRQDLFHKAHSTRMETLTPELIGRQFCTNLNFTTNGYGQATNGTAHWIKRLNRPMFLPMAEWRYDGTNWTATSYMAGNNFAQWGGNAGVMNESNTSSRLIGLTNTPHWLWFPGKTNSTFSTLTLTWSQFGLAGLTLWYSNQIFVADSDQYPEQITGSYSETVTSTNQAAGRRWVWIDPSFPSVTSAGMPGDRLVLIWRETGMTTWEGTETWDNDLLAEALDARYLALRMLHCTRRDNTWVNGEWGTRSFSETNVAPTSYWDQVSNKYFATVLPDPIPAPLETFFPWWVPRTQDPLLDGFEFNAGTYFVDPPSMTTDSNGTAPYIDGWVLPSLSFYEDAFMLNAFGDGGIVHGWVQGGYGWQEVGINQWQFFYPSSNLQSHVATTLDVIGTQSFGATVTAEYDKTNAACYVGDVWTGREHRVHFYLKTTSYISDPNVPTNLLDSTTRTRWIMSDWTFGSVVTTEVIRAETNWPFDTYMIEGTSSVYELPLTASITDDYGYAWWYPQACGIWSSNIYEDIYELHYTSSDGGTTWVLTASNGPYAVQGWHSEGDDPYMCYPSSQPDWEYANNYIEDATNWYYVDPVGLGDPTEWWRKEITFVASQYAGQSVDFSSQVQGGPHLIEWNFEKP